MRDPHYGGMCCKSVKSLGALHSWVWKRPRPSATSFSTAKNVELLGLYPIHKTVAASFSNKPLCISALQSSVAVLFRMFTGKLR